MPRLGAQAGLPGAQRRPQELGGLALGLGAIVGGLIALWPSTVNGGEEQELQRRGLGVGAAKKLSADIEAEVRWASKASGVNPDLAVAQFMAEGGGYRNVSGAGAFGPAQLMPDTARGLGVATSINDPNYSWQTNADAGVKYMAQLLARYHGDYARAIVAYNWGPAHADSWDGKLADLPQETRTYLGRILASAERMQQPTHPMLDAGGRLLGALAQHAPAMAAVLGEAAAGQRHPAMMMSSGPHPRGNMTVNNHYSPQITVQGAKDPQETARAIQTAQKRHHSDLIRNLPTRLI